jgi:hypothetical protein
LFQINRNDKILRFYLYIQIRRIYIMHTLLGVQILFTSILLICLKVTSIFSKIEHH